MHDIIVENGHISCSTLIGWQYFNANNIFKSIKVDIYLEERFDLTQSSLEWLEILISYDDQVDIIIPNISQIYKYSF